MPEPIGGELCPFCSAHVLHIRPSDDGMFSVECDNCGARGPGANSQPLAAFLWNRCIGQSVQVDALVKAYAQSQQEYNDLLDLVHALSHEIDKIKKRDFDGQE